MSPTSTSVVKETMNIAQRVSKECKQKYIHVTYDLAIAKIAWQIQSVERLLKVFNIVFFFSFANDFLKLLCACKLL